MDHIVNTPDALYNATFLVCLTYIIGKLIDLLFRNK